MKETEKRAIQELVRQSIPLVMAQRELQQPFNAYRATEQRLYAYPILLDNVQNRYPADIQDLKAEKVTEPSKSIVRWTTQSGVRISPEERQEARILAVEVMLERDRQELRLMDRALGTIKDEPAYPWLEAYYFQGEDLDEMAAAHSVSRQTVIRGKNRLVRVLSLRLYGAEALE